MTDFSPGPSVLDHALRQEAYERAAELELARLACAFLQDSEVNALLFATLVGGAQPTDGSLEPQPTFEAVVGLAAPSGLKLFRLGSTGLQTVPARKAQPFLRELLSPAAREMARLKFSGLEAEPTTRQMWDRKRDLLINAGKPDDAAAIEITDDDEAPEWIDEFRPNIFRGDGFPELNEIEEPTAPDDSHRLEARERAERARAVLIELLIKCDITRKDWPVDVADLGEQMAAMIEAGFGVHKNAAGPMTREIYESVAAALADIDETDKFVHYAYTGKIMELASLVDASQGGSRVERVRRALSRERKREHLIASANAPGDAISPPLEGEHGPKRSER